MIQHYEFQQAYELIKYIENTVPVLEEEFIKHNYLYGMFPCIIRSYGIISDILISEKELDSRLRFSSNFSFNYIRSESQRGRNTAIHFMFQAVPELRLGGDIFDDYDFSEENMFQQSLVLPEPIMLDLEFLSFLKTKDIKKTFVFKRNAFSIDGLLQIKERIQEVLCYLSEKK